MTTGHDTLTKSESVTIAAIEQASPPLTETREIIGAFHTMIGRKAADSFDPWLERARTSLITSFANGIDKDLAGPSCDRLALVEWLGGGPDHQAQARQTSDVRPRQA